MTRIPYPEIIANAMCQIIITLGKVPVTTMSAPSLVGATQISVASDVNFLNDSVLAFWDSSDEELTAIGTKATPGVLPLDFTGKGFTGLQRAHASGAQVTTNLFPYPLGENSEALYNGFPVFGCYVDSDVDRSRANGQNQEFGMLSVHYQLGTVQSVDNRMHSQIWIARQMKRGERDLDDIKAYLEKHYRMNGACEQIVSMAESRKHNRDDPKRPVFSFLLDIQFKGLATPLS